MKCLKNDKNDSFIIHKLCYFHTIHLIKENAILFVYNSTFASFIQHLKTSDISNIGKVDALSITNNSIELFDDSCGITEVKALARMNTDNRM